jgi:hypothetical protein
MEARISALEKDVAAIKTDVAVIRSNYATKEDLHKELHAATWKIVGTIALLCGAVFWMARTITPPQPATAATSIAAPAPQQIVPSPSAAPASR